MKTSLCFSGPLASSDLTRPPSTSATGKRPIAYLRGEGRFVNRDEFPMPTVMLLDLKMPRKNGFEVLEWVQQQSNLTELRTIVLTTSEDIFEVHKAYRLGAASFLTKPLNFTEFKDAIQMVHNYWMMLNRPPSLQRPQKGSLVPRPGDNASPTE